MGRITLLAKYGLLIFLSCLIPTCHAENWIRVQDQFGHPIENAVVSQLIPATAVNTATTEDSPIMDQINKQFNPHVLIINKGQQVSFPNSDDIRHHVYSFSDTKPFEIKLYKGRKGQPIAFDKSGIVVLGCNIHDQMIGYIYVAENENAALTDKNGMVNLTHPATTINVWHPRLSAQSNLRETFELEPLEKADYSTITLTLSTPKAIGKKKKFKPKKFGVDKD